MAQPHPRSEHPSNTLSEPNNDNNNDAHFSSSAFTGDMAKTYTQRCGGCDILLAKHLISLITPSLPPPTSTPTLRILDNACGPLIVTNECLHTPAITAYQSIHISAVDLSPDFIVHNQAILSSPTTTTPWNTPHFKVDTAIMDSTALQFPDSTFHLSLTSLSLFTFADPTLGARELHRTLKPHGITAATSFKSLGWLPLLHEVESVLHPSMPKTRVPMLEPWSVPGKLSSVLRAGGFERVEEGEVEVVAWWGGVDECAFWVTETVWEIVPKLAEGKGEGWREGEGEKKRMERGFRDVLERGVGGKLGDESEVVKGEDGRVGIRMVAFVGVGWK